MATWQAVRAPQERVPWYIWCAVLAVTSATIGGHWDISWHSSIGRDTFLTPAHIAIYMCGVLAGIGCGYLILRTTFFTRDAGGAVHILGFRGPLGAFIAAWGGIAMLTSAPFDNWWHAAYGLDVKIVSPPHIVLIAGIFAVAVGGLILTLGFMNRAGGARRRQLEWMFLYLGGLIVVLLMMTLMEYVNRVLMHSSLPYEVLAVLLPVILAAIARASSHRFPATIVTAIYTVALIGFILILPRFPAEPKLGPVYQNVTQFIPPQFPALLIVPAFLLDLFWQRTAQWNKWAAAGVSGVVFVAALLAVEWPFVNFLMSPAARNWFFGTIYLGYYVHPNGYIANNRFMLDDSASEFWTNIAWAALFAAISTRAGFAWGDWMKKVRR